jgi:hypothetical protein
VDVGHVPKDVNKDDWDDEIKMRVNTVNRILEMRITMMRWRRKRNRKKEEKRCEDDWLVAWWR